jgi:hypothetical protein
MYINLFKNTNVPELYKNFFTCHVRKHKIILRNLLDRPFKYLIFLTYQAVNSQCCTEPNKCVSFSETGNYKKTCDL